MRSWGLPKLHPTMLWTMSLGRVDNIKTSQNISHFVWDQSVFGNTAFHFEMSQFSVFLWLTRSQELFTFKRPNLITQKSRWKKSPQWKGWWFVILSKDHKDKNVFFFHDLFPLLMTNASHNVCSHRLVVPQASDWSLQLDFFLSILHKFCHIW